MRVSSTSVDRARAARQVPHQLPVRRRGGEVGRHAASSSAGQPATHTALPSRRARRAGSRRSASQSGRRRTEDDRRGARRVRVEARSRGHRRRRPGAARRPARPRVEDVVHLAGCRPPATNADPELARPPPCTATLTRACSGGVAWSSSTRDDPTARGSRPGDGDVPAERDDGTGPRVSATRPAIRSAANAFADAPRSSSTPRRDADGPARQGPVRPPASGRPARTPRTSAPSRTWTRENVRSYPA